MVLRHGHERVTKKGVTDVRAHNLRIKNRRGETVGYMRPGLLEAIGRDMQESRKEYHSPKMVERRKRIAALLKEAKEKKGANGKKGVRTAWQTDAHGNLLRSGPTVSPFAKSKASSNNR